MSTWCCGRPYSISSRAPIYGHDNISDPEQCVYLASRVIGPLSKLTNWGGGTRLTWVTEWRSELTGPWPGTVLPMLSLTLGATFAMGQMLYLRYCVATDTVLHVCRKPSVQQVCAYCRGEPETIRVVPYAYGWEPCPIPPKENAVTDDAIMINDNDSDHDSIDDVIEFLDITDDEERDLDYIPPQEDIEGGESDDGNELPSIQPPRHGRHDGLANYRLRRSMHSERFMSDFMRMDEDNVRTVAMQNGMHYDMTVDFDIAGADPESRRLMGHHPNYCLGRPWHSSSGVVCCMACKHCGL